MSKIQRPGVALLFISVLLHHAIAIMSLCTALVEKVGLTTGQSGLERENFKPLKMFSANLWSSFIALFCIKQDRVY